MKKTLSALLALLLALSLCVPAFAAYDTPYADSQFFDYGEYSIHYRVKRASDEKCRIMMIHGFAMSSDCFEELSDILADSGCTCVLADLPDFGYSTRETADMTKKPREEIIHALMESLGGGRWYVAGHSMGGYVALALAEKYPDSVENLLLYGTAGNDGVSPFVQKLMTNGFTAKLLGKFLQTAAGCKPLVKLLLKVALADKDYAKTYDTARITEPYKIDGTGVGAIYSFSMLPKTNYDAVRSMPPVLFVNGSKDSVITDGARKNLRAALPDGSVDKVLSGGGHLFIQNMADETARITLEFIESR